ncbi:MAG: hypothetical protein KGS61_13435, partial [Verrucomicrobia bacterium]|nr:hypothetical protein [Verrucomicrobiota bacterium]
DPGPSQAGGNPPGLGRRDFLKLVSLGAAALAGPGPGVVAGPFEAADFERLVPADKKLHPAWVRSLFARGQRTVYRWPESRLIGMPIGGICAGQLYLGGDGKLWHWDIFNRQTDSGSSGPHYARPLEPAAPLDQGFALRVTAAGKSETRALDHTGWAEIAFAGEYPIGFIDYRDPESPVRVALEAFSPFIPLNPEDSALPATVMRFTVTNVGKERVVGELGGWLENAVCLDSAEPGQGQRRNRIVRRSRFLFLECSAEPWPGPESARRRPDIVFDDFERSDYAGWTATGTAFGRGPVAKGRMPAYQGDVGAHGRGLVNSHASAPGNSVSEKDAATGTLTSRPFTLQRDYITFLIGGGAHPGKTCLNLLVDERVVLSATGRNDNRMRWHDFDVRPWVGKTARLQIVDSERGAWGNIGIDDIVFTDVPREGAGPLAGRSDFGTMGMALLESEIGHSEPAEVRAAADRRQVQNRPGDVRTKDFASAALPEPGVLAALFADHPQAPDAATRPFGQKLVGSLARRFALAPGQSAVITFILTWHFPNLRLAGLGEFQGRWYGRRFPGARAVAAYIGGQFDRLATQTRQWHDTWYDATLPHWLLERTLLNTSILATSTCHWLGNGRFYAWEGVGCCAGTCTHVWHYAQAPGRLFPAFERSLRERVDYGVAFDPNTGRIRFRAECNDHWAVDGQAGVILRTYREHQMSADAAFLRRVWPRARRALEFLIGKDAGPDGMIDGPQHNTLDADWWGHIAWLSGLYLAALRAGEEMAREMGDVAFADRCRGIFEQGRRGIDEQLFNGEYFFQRADPGHPRTVGSYEGCEIDQVFGQSWAWQVGLGRVLDEAKVKTALRSLWRYNFTPDVGPYRQVYRPGRWYAMAGEGGLLMCTWPRGEGQRVKESFDYYFNECMTGFEYQAASHMIREGLVQEGLAVTRMIHDRYHAARRNPWNEVECGDHYARAMASYGVFLAVCGYEYHGPQGYLGFAPCLSAEDFQCAFTAAEGWGTLSQKWGMRQAECEIAVHWGRLRLRTLALGLPGDFKPVGLTMTVAGRRVPAVWVASAGKTEIHIEAALWVKAGQRLRVSLAE